MKWFEERLEGFLSQLARIVSKTSVLWIVFFLGLSVASGIFTAKNLGVNTDLSEMISEDLPFHKRWVEYKNEFPYLSDTLVLVVEDLEPVDREKLPTLQEAFTTRDQLFEKVFLLENPESEMVFLEVKPVMDYEALLPAEPGLLEAREIVAQPEFRDLDIRITGVAALAYEELQSVSKGAWVSALLSLLLVALILILAFRSASLIGATLINLLCGLVLTAGFATLAVGHLNMISVAFAVLFIGLGIDFSIHTCLRVREKRRQGLNKNEAIQKATTEIGSSLLLCTLTTSCGFFAFVPTAYQGVSELGLISGVGMFINLLVHLFFLPSLLHILPSRVTPQKSGDESSWKMRVLNFPLQKPKLVLRSTVILVGLSVAGLVFIRFDANPLNLQDPTTEAFQTYQGLLEDPSLSPWSIKILKESREEVVATEEKLAEVKEVGRVLSILDFEPDPQKLAQMSEMQREALKAHGEMVTPRFVSPDGTYRVEVFPREPINSVEKMREFSEAVLSVEPAATDDPVTIPKTGDAVVEAFVQAGLTAVIVIFLLLWLILRRVHDAVLVLIPVFVGGILCVGIMEIFGIAFNFANIIVLPLLLGIGVDSGVHLVDQFRQLGSVKAIFRSTSSGVFFSALTTISSFGTLALSAHRGTASMGLVLTIGTFLMMVSTLMILPVMLSAVKADESKKLKEVA